MHLGLGRSALLLHIAAALASVAWEFGDLSSSGEDIFSFREILEEILKELQLKRKLISIPFTISKKLAFFLEKLPGSVLTRDQVEMLKVDNIITAEYDYRKHIKYLPFPFKKILKRQLIFLKKEGGHFS